MFNHGLMEVTHETATYNWPWVNTGFSRYTPTGASSQQVNFLANIDLILFHWLLPPSSLKSQKMRFSTGWVWVWVLVLRMLQTNVERFSLFHENNQFQFSKSLVLTTCSCMWLLPQAADPKRNACIIDDKILENSQNSRKPGRKTSLNNRKLSKAGKTLCWGCDEMAWNLQESAKEYSS